MAMNYTVQRGDTLYDIGKKYGISWTDIYNANKGVIPSMRSLNVGSKLTIPVSGGSTDNAINAFTAAAQTAKKGTEVAPKNFSEVVPWEKFLPADALQRFSESRINPEYQRAGEAQVNQNDWATGLANTFRSGFAQKARQDIVDANERARKAAIADYVQTQTDIFNNLYQQEMKNYYNNPANYLPQYDEYIKKLLPSGA